MLRRFVVLAAAVSIPLIGCSEAPTTPQVAPQYSTTNTKTAVSGTITNPCTGEDIVVQGIQHLSIWTNGDTTKARLNTHTTAHGVGVLSGAKYVVVGGSKAALEFSTPPGSSVNETSIRNLWQSQGGADNFWSITRYTITNDGGIQTIEVHQMETECKG